MAENNEITERVLRYLEGSMEASELSQFEEELTQNEELRQELDFQSMLSYSLIMNEPIEVAETATPEKETTHTPPGKVVKLNKWAIYAAAASIAVVFFIIANIEIKPSAPLVNNKTDQPTIDTGKTIEVPNRDISALAAVYFKREDIPASPVGIIDHALEAYQQGETNEILDLNLEQLPQIRDAGIDSLKIQSIGNFYKGIALYEKKRYQKSIRSFEQVVAINLNDTLTYKANWYLGLNYVSLNDSTRAINALTKVSANPISLFKKASLELIKKIQE